MLTKKSRYRDTERLNLPSDAGFSGLRPRQIAAATGVVEHEIQAGDRLDALAQHYYEDDRLWWRIVDANPRFLFGPRMLGPEAAGEVILIPKAKE